MALCSSEARDVCRLRLYAGSLVGKKREAKWYQKPASSPSSSSILRGQLTCKRCRVRFTLYISKNPPGSFLAKLTHDLLNHSIPGYGISPRVHLRCRMRLRALCRPMPDLVVTLVKSYGTIGTEQPQQTPTRPVLFCLSLSDAVCSLAI